MSRREEDEEEAVRHHLLGMALGEDEGVVTPEEQAMILGQVYYLIKDEDVLNMIKQDKHLCKLLPAFSHLLRTSFIDNKTAHLMKLRLKRAFDLLLLEMDEDEIDLEGLAKIDALLNYAYAAIEDAKGGWRGKLVTERVKIFKIERGEKKKRRWWPF